MCCLALNKGRNNSTAASNQASRVGWVVMVPQLTGSFGEPVPMQSAGIDGEKHERDLHL